MSIKLILKVFVVNLLLLILVSSLCYAGDAQQERFDIAVKAFSDGFYDASRLLFKRFIEEFPKSEREVEAKLYIAKCYYYNEKYPESIEVLDEIRKKSQAKDFIDEAYYWLSVIYLKGKDFANSLQYAEKIIDNFPDSKFRWRALYLIAKNDLELGRIKEAIEIFNKIINKSEEEELLQDSYEQLLDFYFLRKNYSEVGSLGKKYLDRFAKGRLLPKIYFYLGESYYLQGNWDESLINYQRALENCQDRNLQDLIYQGLGFAYLSKGQRVEAKVTIDNIKDKELRLFSQGLYYSKAKNYVEALETFNIFLRDYPQSAFLPQGYLHKADILYEMGRLNDAIDIYKYILDNFKDSQLYGEVINKAHYGLAWCYLKNGIFKKAIEEFRSTLEYADDPLVKVSSKVQIADAYQETAKYDQALNIYNEILRDYPNTIYADYIQFQIGMSFLKKKDLEKAFFALRNLQNNFPSSRLLPQAQYYLAVGYFSAGDYSEAKNLLQDFIERFPNEGPIWKAKYLYGKCFFNEKNYKKALSIFTQIVGKSDDKEIEELTYIDMGNAYLNLSQFDKAKEVWKDFIRRFAHSQYAASVILYLGGLYEKEANFNEAQRYYKRVADNYQGTSWAHEALLSLGHLYWEQQELNKAQEYFEQLANQESLLALKARLYLAKIFEQQDMDRKALKLYDQLIDSQFPIAKIALAKKALLLKEMKDYNQAIKLFKKAIAAGVDTPVILFSLGVCLEKIGSNKEAIEEYFKIIYAFLSESENHLNSDVKNYAIKAYFRMARIYEKENNIKAAQNIYKKIVDLGVEESKIAKAKLKELETK